MISCNIVEVFDLREIVSCERHKLTLTKRSPKWLHNHFHLLSGTIMKHHIQLLLGQLRLNVINLRLVSPSVL